MRLSAALALTVVGAALLFGACGAGEPALAQEPYPSAAEIMAKSRQAMESAASYRVRGQTEISGADGQLQRGSYYAEWAAPDRVYTRHEPTDGGEATVVEVLAADGRHLRRHSNLSGGEWFEQRLGTRAVTAPGALPELPAEPRLDGVEVVEGQPVYHVVIATEEVDPMALGPGESATATTQHLFVSSETYRLVRTVIERVTYFVGRPTFANDPPPAPEWYRTKTTSDFYDYDEHVVIELPDVVVPLPRPDAYPPPPTPTPAGAGGEELDVIITLEAALPPTEAQWAQIAQVIERRLANVGGLANVGAHLVLERKGDRLLTVRVPAHTAETDRAIKLLTTTGTMHIVERVCLTSRCELESEYDDVPTGITGSDVETVLRVREWPSDRVAVVLKLNANAARQLAALTQRLVETNDTDSPDQLAALLDGETLVAAEVDEVILDGIVRISGDFAYEQAKDLSALLTNGPLPVRLRFVGAEPAP